MTIGTAPAARRAAARPEPARRTVDRRSVDGAVLGQVVLDPETFGIEPHVAVMHQVVTAQLAAARAGTQSTRTRAEVAGGGAKPFRQKGTGRARQGSTRAPQWSGGGVALGPKPRSYRQKTPKKMIRLALRSALSDRAAEGKVALVDTWGFEEPKTKAAVAALDALALDGRVLVVLDHEDVVAERSFGNLPRVQVLLAGELNAYDVLRSDWVVFTDETLPGGVTEAEGSTPRPAPARKADEAAAEAPARGRGRSRGRSAEVAAADEAVDAAGATAAADEAVEAVEASTPVAGETVADDAGTAAADTAEALADAGAGDAQGGARGAEPAVDTEAGDDAADEEDA